MTAVRSRRVSGICERRAQWQGAEAHNLRRGVQQNDAPNRTSPVGHVLGVDLAPGLVDTRHRTIAPHIPARFRSTDRERIAMKRESDSTSDHPYAKLWRAHGSGAAGSWTPQRVSHLNRMELYYELSELGIAGQLLDPLPASDPRRSAWQFAQEEWIPFTQSTDPGDLDFVRLAACVLWSVIYPFEPSQEMLHDHYAAAEVAYGHSLYDEVFVHGSILWRLARRRLVPEMRTTAEAGVLLLPGDDFEEFTHMFAAATVEVKNSGCWNEAIPLAEMLLQFSGETPKWRASIMSELALTLVDSDLEASDRVLAAALEQYPDSGHPYLALMSVPRLRKRPSPQHLREVIAIVERGLLTLPAKEAAEYDLAEFLQEVRRDCLEAMGGLRVVDG